MAFVIKVIADTSFYQGLLTAVCSAIVSGAFLLLSVHMTQRRTETKVDEAKEQILEGQEQVKQTVEERI